MSEDLLSQIREKDRIIVELKNQLKAVTGQLRIQSKTIEKSQETIQASKKRSDILLEEKFTFATKYSDFSKDNEKLKIHIRLQDKELKSKEKVLEDVNNRLQQEMQKFKIPVDEAKKPSMSRIRTIPPTASAYKKENELLHKQLARSEKQLQALTKQVETEKERKNKAAIDQLAIGEQIKKLKIQNQKLLSELKRVSENKASTGVGSSSSSITATVSKPPSPSLLPQFIQPAQFSTRSRASSRSDISSPLALEQKQDDPQQTNIMNNISSSTASLVVLPPSNNIPILSPPSFSASPSSSATSPLSPSSSSTALAPSTSVLPSSTSSASSSLSSLPSSSLSSSSSSSAAATAASITSGLVSSSVPTYPASLQTSSFAPSSSVWSPIAFPHSPSARRRIRDKLKYFRSLPSHGHDFNIGANSTGSPSSASPGSSSDAQRRSSYNWLELAKDQLQAKDNQIMELTKQIKKLGMKCTDVTHLELAKRLEDAEKAIADRDEAVRELNRLIDKEREDAMANEKTLRDEVLDLRRQLDECPEAEDMEMLTADVTQLQQAVLDYQSKYEDMKKSLAAKQAELDNSFSYAAASKFKGPRQKEAQLAEQVVNLQFQIYYGNSKKDEEIEDLKQKLDEALAHIHNATSDNTEVDRLKKKFVSFKDKEIEDWLFSGDLAEAL